MPAALCRGEREQRARDERKRARRNKIDPAAAGRGGQGEEELAGRKMETLTSAPRAMPRAFSAIGAVFYSLSCRRPPLFFYPLEFRAQPLICAPSKN